MALTGARFIGSEIYRGSSYGGWHPLRVPRVSTVMDLGRALGWLPGEVYVNSPRARAAAIEAWHTPAYVAALREAEEAQEVSDAVRERHAIGTGSNPVFPEMFRRPATSSGGVILAGEMLRDGGIVHVPGGGTHHAFPDRANGFCYFNDPVLGILSMRHYGARRIAYVDIDAHHCDGVDHAFRDDPDTLLVSTHEEGRWPRTGPLEDEGAGNVFNLPLPKGVGDDGFALARDRVILPAVAAFRPDGIVIQTGADGVLEDPQSRMALSNNAHFDVVGALMGMAPRLMVVGGGGYNPWSVGRAWTGIWGVLSGREVPVDIHDAARDVLRALTWDRRGRVLEPEPHWVRTLRDAPRPGEIGNELRSRVARLAARIG